MLKDTFLLDVAHLFYSTGLGYRGFKIIHLPPGKTVVSGNNVNATVTASPYWEMMLLNSAQLDPSGQLYNHAKEVILQDEVRYPFCLNIISAFIAIHHLTHSILGKIFEKTF